jgi:DMSO/TMAO reductase YedYZ molybdopterin-dependent catalytic subunit
MNRSDQSAEERDVAEPEPKRYGRGLFLATVAGGLSSLVWGRPVWSHVSAALAPIDQLVPFVPSGWRIYTVSGSMPHFDPATWRLQVGGLVENELELDYNDLRALPRVKQISDFHCVTGWSVDNVHWTGVRLTDVLARARPRAKAHGLRFTSAEVPYVDGLTMKQAQLHDVMLAYGMNGKPLPREHGAPLRLVIPEMYGYKNVKWLSRIDLVPEVELGYWENLGYDRDAWVGRSNGY